MEEKIIKLIGEENLNKIKKAKILLVGIGGVGSFAYECLIRSGFLDITIIDNDKVNNSNINRQLIADLSTINEYKVDIARSKAANINNDIKLTIHNIFLDKNYLNLLETDYDEKEFLSAVKGLENEKEGGARCNVCFALRLKKTALLAKELGFDYFGTTLTISPHKNEQTIIIKGNTNKYSKLWKNNSNAIVKEG